MTSPWSCCPRYTRHLGPGTSHAAPASATTTPAVVAIGEGNNSTGVAYEGAAHALWFSWQTYGTSQWHPEEVAGPGTTYSAPRSARQVVPL